MFGIPEWALGVGFIILAGSVARAMFGGFPHQGGRRGLKASKRDLAQTLEEVEKRLTAVEDAQTQLGGVEGLKTRLGEVEERLDFAERLLAKQRDADRLAPPQT